MHKFDKFALGGFLTSFGIYYMNASNHFISDLNLNSTLYNYSVGGIPEYFTGVLGVRLANLAGEFYKKILDSKKIKNIKKPKNLESFLNNIKENSLTYSTISATTLILGLGTIDETLYNISGGTQDLKDILMYALGVGTTITYNYKTQKKNK
jgi:hypothetical protein